MKKKKKKKKKKIEKRIIQNLYTDIKDIPESKQCVTREERCQTYLQGCTGLQGTLQMSNKNIIFFAYYLTFDEITIVFFFFFFVEHDPT